MSATTARRKVVLAVACCLLRLTHAMWNYAVYYDPNEEPNRNPFGRGFTPKGPEDWDQVDFYDGFIAFPDVDYGPNMCTTKTAFGANSNGNFDHQQSPIEVEDGPYWACNDRHTTHKFGGTSCNYRFRTSPYGLIAKFECGKNPYMDMSRTTTWWYLDYIEVKTPGEHVIGTGDYKPGNFESFDGELRLVHKGTCNDMACHNDRIAVIAVMLKVQSGAENNRELENYIKGWESAQARQYQRCNLEYNNNRCSLRSSRNLREQDNQTSYRIAHDDEDEIDMEFPHSGFVQSLMDAEDDWEEVQDHGRDLQRVDAQNFRPYRLPKMTGTEHYYGYDGSMTVPPCSERVWWRIMRQPLIVSNQQMRRLNNLVARHLECFGNCNCELSTAGRRKANSCHVDVTRPLQFTDDVHHVTDCVEWHVDDTV